MVVSNRNLLFQGSIFRGYVSFRGVRSDANIHISLHYHLDQPLLLSVTVTFFSLMTLHVQNFGNPNPYLHLTGLHWVFRGEKKDPNYHQQPRLIRESCQALFR